MRRRLPRQRKPVEIGLPWSLFFIPVLFVAAGFSIPYTFVVAYIQRRQQRAFKATMQASGRVMTWSDFIRALSDERRGTFIVERSSFKGPVRWWWTTENVYEQSPYPIADWLTMCIDESFCPFAEWFRDRYTNVDKGKALLVEEGPTTEIHSLSARLQSSESGDVRWVEVAPPKRLHQK
jgi:hypothetical protein